MTITINVEILADDMFRVLGPGEQPSNWTDTLVDMLEERYQLETLVREELRRMNNE